MTTKSQLAQRVIRQWQEASGKSEVDMHEVAKFALANGWRPPPPISVVDLVAKDFSRAAREEIKYDKTTRRPYRVWHAYRPDQRSAQMTLWVDIDDAPRAPMSKSITWRREMMVDDGMQLSLDADHWNSVNPSEEPIAVEFDLSPDIEWRKNAPDEDEDEDKKTG